MGTTIDKYFRLLPLLAYLFLCSTSFFKVRGEVHYYDFVLKDTNFTKLCTTNTVPVINGSFPGPNIRVHRGDTIYVNFHNHGSYGVTLHWHGVKQPRNPWSDGPEYITQCPVQPGSNFTYHIILSDEEGTLWWHAHSDWTRATVHGAIIILPANGTTYPFPNPDVEEVIILGNWYVGDLAKMVKEDLEIGAEMPHSNAYTINGEPGDLCSCSNGTTYRMMVDYDKTYLLRLVNAATNAELFFAIAGHTMTVVGMDASYTKPFSTAYLMLSTGQTVDVLFTADQSPSHYYMAARQYSSDSYGLMDFDLSNATAILQYHGNYTPPDLPEFPTTLPSYKDNFAGLNYTNHLRSLADAEHLIEVPLNVSERMVYVVSMGLSFCPNKSCDGVDGYALASSINNITFVNPSIDILSAYYSNLTGVYETGFPNDPLFAYNYTGENLSINLTFSKPGTEVKVLEFGETVEIVFQGTNLVNAAENHPIHLHGHSFYVVGNGVGNFDYTNDTKSFNLVDPPRLNTVSVPNDGWSAIRFTAKNPGVWFLHCHYDRHMTWGMDMAFIVKDGNTSSTTVMKPPNYMPLCNVTFDSNTSINQLISNGRVHSN